MSVDVSPRTSRSRVPRYEQGAGLPWRVLATVTTLALTLPFAIHAQHALEQGAFDYGQHAEWQSRLLIFVPLAALALTTAASTFRIAIAIYWAWSFVFLGLAPAIQLARQSFPWTGTFSVKVIEEAQSLVLLGHVSFAILAWFMSRRGSDVPQTFSKSRARSRSYSRRRA